MVLDPLSALGLAGNIVQFVDFACKLIAETRELYYSESGLSSKAETLDTITQDLRRLSDGLEVSSARGTSAAGPLIRTLAFDCKQLADDISRDIKKLQVSSKSKPHQRWASFRAALKATLGENTVLHLSARIDTLRNEVSIRMLSLLNDRQSEMLQSLQRIEIDNRILSMNRTSEFRSLKEQIVNAITDLQSDAQLEKGNIKEHFLHLQLDREISQRNVEALSQRLTSLSSLLAEFVTETRTVATEQMVLKSLSFPMLKMRVGQIPDAHPDTFGWIFADEFRTDSRTVSFIDWLASEDGIWWITGKPGSGKSTLMKHISSSRRAENELQKWANARGRKLVTASYFFWNAGTKLQRSQEGLLRSLLLETLCQTPELIHVVCGLKIAQFHPFQADADPWTRKELLNAFEQLGKQSSTTTSYFFLVDGLDEYQCAEEGTHDALVSLLQHLSQSDAIKICVSSREYTVFRDAFKGGHHLKMEDLTKEDIQRFVHVNLEESPRFRELAAEDDRYLALEAAIVDRSNGVFLWVFLVVKSLREGLTYADRISDLERRLNDLPKTLEDFFAHILDSVDKHYRVLAAQAFQVANQAAEPLDLIIYSFLDEEDANFALTLPVQPLTENEIQRRHEDMRRRLDARCKGLLEINQLTNYSSYGGPTTHYKVDFLHRTVRDYLFNAPDMQKMLRDRLPNNFSPQYQLCKAFLANLKTVKLPEKSTPKSPWTTKASAPVGRACDDSFTKSLHDFLFYAEELTYRFDNPPMELLAEAEKVTLERSGQRMKGKRTAFLGACIAHSLDQYLEYRIKDDPQLVNHRGHPLLDFALGMLAPTVLGMQNSIGWHEGTYFVNSPGIRPQFVKLLLQMGANPNQRYKDQTVWGRFMNRIRSDAVSISKTKDEVVFKDWSAPASTSKADVVTTLGLLVRHGANLDQEVVVKREWRPRRKDTGRAADLYGSSEVEVQTTAKARDIIAESVLEAEAEEIWAQIPRAKIGLAKLFSWIHGRLQ
ncbi:hypothetical protein K432DRAFT_354034 [Lepidopterella palustris CBS 459.81]|uniref:NACHT domain-containing protein n=1 Tax=Lepidopterella palustris CBS 459.81 TaxID=1314670 RepID=A0A8E2E9P2_9PEZI|nr:hypothetical protein K432DRAFT_354034 [Lepidopterella palustris CBS 459.81]